MGVKVFVDNDLTTTQIIKETIEVAADGSVSFRARLGKGSGKPVNIPGDQFDKFVKMMNDTAEKRKQLAEEAKELLEKPEFISNNN